MYRLKFRVIIGSGVWLASTALSNAQQQGPDLKIARSQVTGLASFVSGADGGVIPVQAVAGQGVRPADFLRQHGGLFGVTDADAQLVVATERTDNLGQTHTTFRQVHRGVTVFGGVLKVHQDVGGGVRAANGAFFPDAAKVNPVATLRLDRAVAAARRAVRQSKATVEHSELVIVDPGWYGDPPRGARLAYYMILAHDGPRLREALFVEAHTGEVLDQWNLLHTGLYREVYDDVLDVTVRLEGDPPTGDPDADAAYDYAADAYLYWANAIGRDSYDDLGGTMSSVVHLIAPDDCPNAFGGGGSSSFCDGTAADDLVAHEWTHSLTDYTARLIYQNQPGQLNESYSDVVGELVDLFNGDASLPGTPGGTPWPGHATGPGTDTPNSTRGALCVTGFALDVNSPGSIASTYAAGSAAFGPALDGTGLTGDVAAAEPAVACSPITNPAAIAGKIALIDRGSCTFVVKVKHAQDAGATGVIVVNSQPFGVLRMTGTDPTITIPSVFLSNSDGQLIRTGLAEDAVNVTMRADAVPSVRWMVFEDAWGYGGAIRDMWNPTCFGNPDRANHPLQRCTVGDNGGVHNGSGIPNHAFAIVSDGSTFNGYAVSAIGPIKSGAVWLRALTTYLTVTSDFRDAYHALNQAAQDLIGSTPADPRTGAPSASTFTAGDAAEVDKALRAVEMDTAGSCGSGILFDEPPNPPAGTCSSSFSDDFESGPGDWSVSNTGPNTPYDWYQTDGSFSYPAGSGTVWYVSGGAIDFDCAVGDESAVHSLFSPVLALPGGVPGFEVRLNHLFTAETGWDGGNVSISVNSGAWSLLPGAAFTYNGYNASLIGAASGNTNPLAGQEAFTGLGGWGTSVIDLAGFVSAGDTVQFRFDFGKDACNGDEDWYAQGWYIDAFEVLACDPFLASGSAKMYWADRDTGKVQRADLDGSNVEDLVTGLVEPTDTTIDATSGKLYWSERISDKIRRANLDGTDVEDVIASGQESPLGLQVDPSAGKIYWLDGTVRIRRADLDGSNIETLISGLNFVTGLALDVGGGKMYYANQNAGLRTEILRANLDGTGQETLVTWPTASGGARIALDLVNDKAYWADQVTDEIQRSDLDGSNIVLIYDATGASTMTGIAVDPAGGKVYWTDSDQDAIRRANLDGSGVEDLIIGGGLLKPGGITVGTGTFTEPVGPILYVDAAATGNHDGSSWTHAFRYLQDALTASAASGGDVTEIWVAAGTYRPDRGLGLVPGDRSATFELQSGVTIYGGFASVLSLPDPSERDELSDRAPLVHASVLSGDLSGDDDAADFPNGATFADNSYHVVTFEGMASAGLDGFTVTAGNADGEVAPTNFGGGLVSSFGTPTIANCTFRQNHASYGSAVFVASSDPTLIDCRFESNTATWDGGAIYVGGTANPTLTRCVFSGNTARNGGAIANEADGSLTAVSCVFAGNQTSAGGGGAVLVSASDATLVNCELSGNRAGNGGAMVITNASTATISSCTLADNTAALTGGAVAVYSSAVTMSSCILWGNMDGGGGDESAQIHLHGTATASVDYSLLQGLTGALGGSGNIDGDPRFVDAAAGDLQLRSGSPAIDAGDTTALPADDADVDTDGNPFERLPLDLAGVVRLIDDPDTSNTGLPAAGVCTDPPRVGLGCATDADCEPGICDLGGTAPTVVDMGAFEFYPDCNDNDVPDICDLDCFAFGGDCAIMLSCGTSVDLNEDGRPDECASASSGGAWSDDIWGLGGSYPDDDAGVSGVHVLLDGATSAAASLLTDVLLDVPAKISSLTLRNDATLKMIESATAADLEVVDGGVDNEGAMLLGFDRVMDLTAGSEPQPLKVGPGGMIRKDPTVTDYSSASIRTGDVILHAGGCGTSGCKNGGIVELTDSMFLSVQGDLTLDGAVAVSATAVAGGAFAPPFLRLVPATAGAGGIAAALLTVPSVTVTGKMSILRYSQVTNESPGGVLLHGDFENKSVAPSMFDWTGGALTMTPAPAEPPFNGAALLITSAPQRFEVAGLDLGPVADGFATDADTLFDSDPHTNFTIEALTIGEPSTVAGTGTCQVSFVNEFANTAALGPCQEAAYFRECTFNAGCSVILEDVNVYCGSIQDLGADIVESGCGTLQIVALAPDPFGGCANDFELASNGAGGERLSRFGCVATPQPPAAAGGGGSAIRVVFRTLYNTAGGDPDGASVCAPRSLLPSPPPSLSQFEGQTRWLGAPVEIVDEAAPTPPNYIGAPLACTAAGAGVRDWSPAGLAATFGVDADTSRIFFYDSGVVPCSVYEVSHCSDAMNEATCSDPVLVFTSRMADAWPPFEVVGQPSFTDINAVVGKYKGIPFAPGNPPLGGAPEWHAFQKGNVVGDYNLSVVNKKVGFLDIGVAVDGYKGIPYKEPGPCNPATGLDNCGNACSTAP